MRNHRLPPLPLTGVGSLPELKLEEALHHVFSLDIPYLPTFPGLGEAETLLGQLGLGSQRPQGGLKGLHAHPAWLDQLQEKKVGLVKIQWPGPLALAQALLARGERHRFPQLARAWKAQLDALLTAMEAFRERVAFFLDEPGLGSPIEDRELEKASWWVLEEGLQRVQNRGFLLGMHCCGEVPWLGLAQLPLQVFLWDWELEADRIKQYGPELRAWVGSGGILGLGLVPTVLDPGFDPMTVVDHVLERFHFLFGASGFQQVLGRTWLSPACGLGMRSVEDFHGVFSALHVIRNELLRRLNLK